jgi:hypothetical protein
MYTINSKTPNPPFHPMNTFLFTPSSDQEASQQGMVRLRIITTWITPAVIRNVGRLGLARQSKRLRGAGGMEIMKCVEYRNTG